MAGSTRSSVSMASEWARHWTQHGIEISTPRFTWRDGGLRIAIDHLSWPQRSHRIQGGVASGSLLATGTDPRRAWRNIVEKWPPMVHSVTIHGGQIQHASGGLSFENLQITRVADEQSSARGESEIQLSLAGAFRATFPWTAFETDISGMVSPSGFQLRGRFDGSSSWSARSENQASAIRVALWQHRRRRASMQLILNARSGRPDRISLHADGLELDWLEGLQAPRESSSNPAWSIATSTGKIDLDARLEFTGARSELRIDRAALRAIELWSPPLANRALTLQLQLEDTLFDSSPRGIFGRSRWQLGDLHGQSSIELRPDRSHIVVEVETNECRAWLESMPKGLLPRLAGTRLGGRVGAHLRLSVQHSALAELAEELGNARFDPVEWDAPGQLDLHFPFLQACRVLDEPAIADFSSLAHGYRHRFIDAGGQARERVLSQGRRRVRLGQLPGLADAFVHLEDGRFWVHDGFDLEQLERAFWRNLAKRAVVGGASTITQQTAKNLWLGGERTLARKLQEAFLASRLEARLSKRDILELYLSIIELDVGVHGVHDGAQHHFGRSPAQLNALEALHLAALAPSPARFSESWRLGRVDRPWLERIQRQRKRAARSRRLSRRAWWLAGGQRLDLLDRSETTQGAQLHFE